MKRLIALLTVIAACFAAGLQPAFAEDSADGGEKAATRAAAQAKATVKLSVSPSSRTYSASAWTGCSVAVKSNTRWQASSSVSWIKLTRTSGSGNGSVGFKVNANTGSGSRSGRITIRTKGKSVSCTIKQNAKPVTLQTAVSSRKHPASGVSGMALKVKSNVSWTAKSNVSWIKLTRSSGSGNGSLVYNVSANTGSSTRTGTITVSGKGKTAKCKITQDKKTIKLQTAVTSRKHPASGVRGMTLKVTANAPWTARSNVSWIRLTRSSGSGNGTLEYDVPENTGTSDRTGTITVSAQGKTAKCTITQHKKTIKLQTAVTSRKHPASGVSGMTLKVTANVSWTAKSNVSWIRLTRSSGSGDGTLAYDVPENTGSSDRTGTITVSGGGKTAKCTITQYKKTTLSLNASSRTFTSASASGKLLGVTANVKWTAKSSASWLKLSNTGGNGSGNVQYAVAANSGAARTATITVSGGGLSRTFTVTQNGTSSAKANLRFYRPSGWPAAVFVTTSQTSTSEQTGFTARSKPCVCVRLAWINDGYATVGSYSVQGKITGPSSLTKQHAFSGLDTWEYTTFHRYYGLMNASGTSVTSAPSLAGTYTWTFTLDSGNAVAEMDESDNTASVKFTVVSSRGTRKVNAGEGENAGMAGTAAWDADDWVAVTTSDGEDGGVLLDGDEGTAWGPVGEGGGWIVLSYSEPIDVKNVAVKGEGLPEEGVRVLLSEDADEWVEGTEGRAQYVWVVLPEDAAGATVSEIEVEEAE